jgi:hypothetical protein
MSSSGALESTERSDPSGKRRRTTPVFQVGNCPATSAASSFTNSITCRRKLSHRLSRQSGRHNHRHSVHHVWTGHERRSRKGKPHPMLPTPSCRPDRRHACGFGRGNQSSQQQGQSQLDDRAKHRTCVSHVRSCKVFSVLSFKACTRPVSPPDAPCVGAGRRHPAAVIRRSAREALLGWKVSHLFVPRCTL